MNRIEALQFSREFSDTYVSQHITGSEGLTGEQAMVLTCARLEWTLRLVRPQLSGIFSELDIVMLMDCYEGDYFYPEQFWSLASDLCAHLGLELDDYQSTEFCGAVDRVRTLEPIEKMALADALEQASHPGMRDGESLCEFFSSLGIELV